MIPLYSALMHRSRLWQLAGLLLATCSALPCAGEAAEQRGVDCPGLSLADVEALALAKHPALAAARARVAAARGRQVQAGLYPNPVIGYHGTEIGNLNTAGQQGGFVSQRLITGGKLALDQAVAGKAAQAACYQLRTEEQRIMTDVRVRFYESLAAQRRVSLTSELARIGDDLVAATRKLLEGRLRSESDLLQAEIRADEADILLENAQNELYESWRRLAAATAVPNLTNPILCGSLDAPGEQLAWNECTAYVLGNNPLLRDARARAAQAKLALCRAQKEPLPNVDVMVSVRHIVPTDSDVANVQVGIPIPIFNRNQGNICAASAEWTAACREVQRLELRLRDQLAAAYRRYANAWQQTQRYAARIVPSASRSLELVRRGYDTGQVEYLTLLTAQQTYLRVSLAQLDSLRELRTSEALLEGQLLSGSLER